MLGRSGFLYFCEVFFGEVLPKASLGASVLVSCSRMKMIERLVEFI